MSKSLLSISASTIPCIRPHVHHAHARIRDSIQSSVCWLGHVAFRECKGDVSSCLLYVEHGRSAPLPRNVMHFSHPKHFQHYSPKTEGSSHLTNGTLVTDPAEVRTIWVAHFSTLGKSRYSSNPLFRRFN